jgi:hypothetical protein
VPSVFLNFFEPFFLHLAHYALKRKLGGPAQNDVLHKNLCEPCALRERIFRLRSRARKVKSKILFNNIFQDTSEGLSFI